MSSIRRKRSNDSEKEPDDADSDSTSSGDTDRKSKTTRPTKKTKSASTVAAAASNVAPDVKDETTDTNDPVRRSKAEYLLARMGTDVTGVCTGAILKGSKESVGGKKSGGGGKKKSTSGCVKLTDGIVLRYLGPPLPPRKRDIELLKSFPDIWARFKQKLRHLSFFSKMSVAQDKAWFEKLVDQEMNYAQMVEKFASKSDALTAAVQILKLGVSPDAFINLPQKVLNTWLVNKRAPLVEVQSEIIKLTGKSRTLIFLPSMWTMTHEDEDADVPSDFQGAQLVIGQDVLRSYQRSIVGTTTASSAAAATAVSSSTATPMTDFNVNVRHVRVSPDLVITDPNEPTSNVLASHDDTLAIMVEVLKTELKSESKSDAEWLTYVTEQWNLTKQSYKPYSKRTSMYKSILQKTIRFQAQTAAVDKLHTSTFLVCFCIEMLRFPGGLNPELHVFETGMHAFLKRLGVISWEDSAIEKPEDTVHLFECASLCSHTQTWHPHPSYVKRWLTIALQLLNSRRCFTFPDPKINLPPVVLDIKNMNGWQTASFLLDMLKSLPGDYQLFRHVAKQMTLSKTIIQHQPTALKTTPTTTASTVAVSKPPPSKTTTTTTTKPKPTNAYLEIQCAKRPEFMPVSHAVDMHTDPRIVYFFGPKTVAAYRSSETDKMSNPYAPFLSALFKGGTGLNPRRETQTSFDKAIQSPLFIELRQAQVAYSAVLQPLVQQSVPKPITSTASASSSSSSSAAAAATAVAAAPSTVSRDTKEIDTKVETYSVINELHTSWLAGGVGVLRPKVKSKALVTIRIDDNLQSLAVFLPPPTARSSMATKERKLTEEEEDIASREAMNMLERGVKWVGCRPPVPEWKDAIVRLVRPQKEDGTGQDEEKEHYFVLEWPKGSAAYPKGHTILWDDARKINIGVPVIPASKRVVIGQPGWLDFPLRGIQSGAMDELEKDCLVQSPRLRARLLLYVGSFQSSFVLPDIARGGQAAGKSEAGQGQMVHPDDVAVFHILVQWCHWFPSALRYRPAKKTDGIVNGSPTIKFYTTCGPLLWHLASVVRASLKNDQHQQEDKNDAKDSKTKGWPELVDKLELSSEVQRSCAKRMWLRHEQGYSGSPLILPMGTGKTRAFLMYLRHLQENKRLPKYILFTCPYVGFESLVQEFHDYGLTVSVMNPYATTKRTALKELWLPINTPPRPYEVTFIHHDALKDCMHLLTPDIMLNSSFCVDECDETVNNTLRTGCTMTLSELAYDTTIMTGTPSATRHFVMMLPWLRRCCLFDLNMVNLPVGINAMVSEECDTGNTVLPDLVVTAQLTDDELKMFNALAHPKIRGQNRLATPADNTRAIKISDQACTRTMVSESVRRVKEIDPDTKQSTLSGIHIVTDSLKHQEVVYDLLHKTHQIPANQIYRLGVDGPGPKWTLENTKEVYPDVRYLLSPVDKGRCWTATRFHTQITCVYYSSETKRAQTRARINRRRKHPLAVQYITVMDSTGWSACVMQNHNKAKDLNTAIKLAIQSNHAV